MGRTRILSSRKLLKRLRQAVYLGSHPLSHYRCASVIRDSELTTDRLVSLKYLGDHLALSLETHERRQALIGHYSALPELLQPDVRGRLAEGVLLWTKELAGSHRLGLFLEHSTLAPMEGELQLRFSFKSDLYVLTFLLAPGHLFGSECDSVLFIGGVQGGIGVREEMREASRLNGEISPAAMLILAVQAIAKVMGVDELIAISERDHISMSYSPAKIKFNYAQFWEQAGGQRVGTYYRIPIDTRHRALSDIPLAHRRRTKRKREEKKLVQESIEERLREIIAPVATRQADDRAVEGAGHLSRPLTA